MLHGDPELDAKEEEKKLVAKLGPVLPPKPSPPPTVAGEPVIQQSGPLLLLKPSPNLPLLPQPSPPPSMAMGPIIQSGPIFLPIPSLRRPHIYEKIWG